jgi:diphthamide synthase (EF-2-diphthine--ammonia ligase)
MGLPVIKVWIPPQCPNEVYENRIASTFAGPEFQGSDHVAFADLFLEDIRAYREGRLAQVGKRGVFPIWGRDTAVLAREMIANGFRAIEVPGDHGLGWSDACHRISAWARGSRHWASPARRLPSGEVGTRRACSG